MALSDVVKSAADLLRGGKSATAQQAQDAARLAQLKEEQRVAEANDPEAKRRREIFLIEQEMRARQPQIQAEALVAYQGEIAAWQAGFDAALDRVAKGLLANQDEI